MQDDTLFLVFTFSGLISCMEMPIMSDHISCYFAHKNSQNLYPLKTTCFKVEPTTDEMKWNPVRMSGEDGDTRRKPGGQRNTKRVSSKLWHCKDTPTARRRKHKRLSLVQPSMPTNATGTSLCSHYSIDGQWRKWSSSMNGSHSKTLDTAIEGIIHRRKK